jgi:hypothetical protein
MQRRNFIAAGMAAGVIGLMDQKTSSVEPETAGSGQPPAQATSLFDGKNLSAWLARKGGEANWKISDGYMEVLPGTGDIHTRELFGDFQLHVEFWLPLMADRTGQARANSGVYLQGRYEIQVLDSYGLDAQDNDCGAIYKIARPLVNACRKPEQWQSYDVAFRAALVEDGQLKERPRVTVFHNGALIHNNLEIPMATGGAMDVDMGKPGPILLQDHGNLVRYRNLWIVSVTKGEKE